MHRYWSGLSTFPSMEWLADQCRECSHRQDPVFSPFWVSPNHRITLPEISLPDQSLYTDGARQGYQRQPTLSTWHGQVGKILMANIHSRAPREAEQIFCGVCISDELLCLLNPASVLSFHRCRFLDDTFHPEHHLSICTWGTYLVTALTYSFLYPLRPTRLIKTHPDKPNSFSSVLKQMNRSGKKRWPCR